MRCKRCWKESIDIHTCTPAYHYKAWDVLENLKRTGESWHTSEITDIQEDIINWWKLFVLKLLDWEEKGKYSMIHTSELDNTIELK